MERLDRFEPTRRTLLIGGAAAVGAAAVTPEASAAPPVSGAAKTGAGARALTPGHGLIEPESTFFSTRNVAYSDELDTPASDGDLWPTTWADDGALYTANGDGRGFSTNPNDWSDIVANRIDGTPETGITGVRLAAGDQVARVWTDPGKYNRKPTGIVAVDGDGDGKDELYLVVQDLRIPADSHPHGFNDAPAASIVRSTDYGRTWQPAPTTMFTDYQLTTIFFLDFGQSNRNASVLGPDGTDYVYAYGLDNNWRDSFSNVVPDPVDLWLMRAPISLILDRASWQYFSGVKSGQPTWSNNVADRQAVLRDERRVYPGEVTPDGNSVISQGSVTYNPALKRYFYLSWTEYTWEFYEAPQPWGPWKLFLHKDFGPYPWWGAEPGTPGPKAGGYTTIAPSKFISEDGLTMWVQANWFVGVGHPASNYNLSLRRLQLAQHTTSAPENQADPKRNLARVSGAVVLDKTSHWGKPYALNDGSADLSEDSWDNTRKELDRWGYEWPRAYNVNRVVYTTGAIFDDGGWFDETPRVQVRQNHQWKDVNGLTVDPQYPVNNTAGPRKVYTFAFQPTWGDAVRVIGRPGGSARFTSIAELEVYFV